jgi:hypothetical protein
MTDFVVMQNRLKQRITAGHAHVVRHERSSTLLVEATDREPGAGLAACGGRRGRSRPLEDLFAGGVEFGVVRSAQG